MIGPVCAKHAGPITEPCAECGQDWLAHSWGAGDASFAQAHALKPTRLLCAKGGHPMDLKAHNEGHDVCTSCRERPRIRRRSYWPGTCQDCDREREVTKIAFPDSPEGRHVCRRCVRTYRGIMLAP